MISKESCRNELRTAIRQLSDRCLYSASRWAAEQLVGIEQDPAKATPSHTRRKMKLEHGKLLDEVKARMNEEKLKRCKEVRIHFLGQFEEAEERKKIYYKGLVKAGGLPYDDSSDHDIPQTLDVRGVIEVNEDEVAMEVDDPRPMEVADVQVPEGALMKKNLPLKC
ncbi:hypothetical protein GIB67_032911 [Kingdonia uniflora]|uniref:Cdc23 domain-containing protein n=1 Tax=Kingdonia uniflora TaxID=39325 RepID=A0A7J7MY97_9MAGN|nr:hypothetical protein GIB67_032911 [Kingdonia uniflora]